EWIAGQVRRARRLATSGAFHTPFMAPALEKLTAAIRSAPIAQAQVSVVCNVDASPHVEATELGSALERQLTSRVRWTESVRCMAEEGVTTFHCVGPGDAVAGLVRR